MSCTLKEIVSSVECALGSDWFRDSTSAADAAARAGLLDVLHRLEMAVADVNPLMRLHILLGKIHGRDVAEYYPGFEDEVFAVLAEGVEVDGEIHGRTALQKTIVMGHLRVAQALLDAGADVNKYDPERRTPLWSAVFSGVPANESLAFVKMFIAAGARLDLHGRQGPYVWSVYLVALLCNRRRVLGLLLQHGAVMATARDTGNERRNSFNKASFAYHDKLVAAGGYKAHVKKHRILLSSVVDKVVEAKFGRRAPQEVCAHVVTFWTPPGGF